MTNDKLLAAARNMLESRETGMLTTGEWENLADAVKEVTGQWVEWRTQDELDELDGDMYCTDCSYRGNDRTCAKCLIPTRSLDDVVNERMDADLKRVTEAMNKKDR